MKRNEHTNLQKWEENKTMKINKRNKLRWLTTLRIRNEKRRGKQTPHKMKIPYIKNWVDTNDPWVKWYVNSIRTCTTTGSGQAIFHIFKKIPIHTYVISQPKTMTIGKKFLDGKI